MAGLPMSLVQASAVAMGQCKLPLPAFTKSGGGGEYGAIGDPIDTISGVPEVILRGPTAKPLGLPVKLAGVAGADIRPKMLTAQPLQVRDGPGGWTGPCAWAAFASTLGIPGGLKVSFGGFPRERVGVGGGGKHSVGHGYAAPACL
jgi:hypothetical protein